MKLIDLQVSVTVSDHRDNAHDLSYDLIAGKSGDSFVETLHRGVELLTCNGVVQILMDLGSLVGEKMKVLPPLSGLGWSDA
jgi:hypothetical protein